MQCPECEYQLKDHRELVKHFDDFHADRAGAYTIEWCETKRRSSRGVLSATWGHEQEPALLTMDATSEADIVSLLKEGFKNEQILKKVRETADVQTRLFYTTSRDIGQRMIKSQYGHNESRNSV
ncbi:hypothetical protein NECAME_10207 [Necator americanus]|uniref:C2H2-type domain-containing protein n=1 Tax=Necator americanus TaxID=51031 RepID=W2TBS2_NECAM|nr:hypothetical protein NECAME_10207 [Necator americanus]ETN78646.1 hypothetical protein NECAME_10207 [Necator americanus]